MDYSSIHQAVLLEEILDLFESKNLEYFFDGTLGLAGHALSMLEAHPEIKTFYACDKDQEAYEMACKRLSNFKEKLEFQHTSFLDNLAFLESQGAKGQLDGVLLDLGVSSLQLDEAERGFSFQKEGKLDMRMDRSRGVTAHEIVNKWPEKRIDQVIWEYGEDRRSKIIAKAIAEYRRHRTIEGSLELAKLIEDVVPRVGKKHPATQTFQAIRIVVNRELEDLQLFLEQIFDFLKPKGRLAIISFHSLEDRIVKQAFKEAAGKSFVDKNGVFRKSENSCANIISKKPIVPSKQELRLNPRSRSAKLRVIEKI